MWRGVPRPPPKGWKRVILLQYLKFSHRYGQQLLDIIDFPIKLILSPITIAFDIAGSAPRGFGVPEFISKLSYSAVFAVATFGTYDIALELGKKCLLQDGDFCNCRNCRTCNGWQALQCTMCKGSGKVRYHIKNYTLKSGEKPTAESIADAISENRAELVHLPSTFDLHVPLPSKDCPNCDGSGVMRCPECKDKIPLRISADDIMEPPWQAYNVMQKMDYPYEHIVHSMKDPSIAAFWLITMPEMVGGFKFDDEIKQKIWWEYQESMRYDQLRDAVAKRKPGWEYLQERQANGTVIDSLFREEIANAMTVSPPDPVRARDDPVVVKDIPYYKAKKTLEAELLKLDPPPRPENWGELDLPLSASAWSEEDLKDPRKLNEMTVLLNAQKEIADKFLDAQWETKWRQEKLNEMLEEKVRPLIQELDNGVLPQPIIMQLPPGEQDENNKMKVGTERKKRRWWLF